MVDSLDAEANKLGVMRQSVTNLGLAERLVLGKRQWLQIDHRGRRAAGNTRVRPEWHANCLTLTCNGEDRPRRWRHRVADAESVRFDAGAYNADTLGIRPDLIKRPISSWAELLNPEFKGKASILNIPSIGIMDAAMVVESMGIYKYPDKGNMTKKEIDLTIKTLIEAKKAGQFRSLWKDFNESVNLMASGEVVIQSMWSPAVTAVRTKGIACTFQPLKEGYRSWASGFGLPTTLSGKKLDGAYEFINWFLDGWAGAYLNRQGYYSAVLETAKAKMEPYEWAYWMEGKPAAQDIKSPHGDLLAKAGEIRDGGSYEQRMGAVACWNALMNENTYMVQKWNEFVASLIMPSIIVSLGIGLEFRLLDSGIKKALELLGWQSTLEAYGSSLGLFTSALGAHLTWTLPFGLLIMFAIFNRFNPAYEEAARDLGATPWQGFRHVVLPLIAPSVVGIGMFGFTLSWDEIARTSQAIGDVNTLPLELQGLTTTVTTPSIYALGTVTIVVSFVVMGVAVSLACVLARRQKSHRLA